MPQSDACEIEGCENPAKFVHVATYTIEGLSETVRKALRIKSPVLKISLCELHSAILQGDSQISTEVRRQVLSVVE